MPNKVWDEVIYPFPNFNIGTAEDWKWDSNVIPRIIMGVITYPRWHLKLTHVSKRGFSENK